MSAVIRSPALSYQMCQSSPIRHKSAAFFIYFSLPDVSLYLLKLHSLVYLLAVLSNVQCSVQEEHEHELFPVHAMKAYGRAAPV